MIVAAILVIYSSKYLIYRCNQVLTHEHDLIFTCNYLHPQIENTKRGLGGGGELADFEHLALRACLHYWPDRQAATDPAGRDTINRPPITQASTLVFHLNERRKEN